MGKRAPIKRTGEINCHDSAVSVWEEIPDGVASAVVFAGVRKAFGQLLDHLRSRGFALEADRSVDKLIRDNYWVGRKVDLEVYANTCGCTMHVEFFQNVDNVENSNGGKYDFGKLAKMPRDMRLRCVVEMVRVIRTMQSIGYAFGPKSRLCEPLPLAVVRKAEGREKDDLSPLERFNDVWGADRFKRGEDGWPSAEEMQSYGGCRDRDGEPLSNGAERYFRHDGGRLAKGRVYTDMSGMWTVVYPDGRWLSRVSAHELFQADRPDLLPRRVVRESQLSRVSRELAKARVLLKRQELPSGLEKLAPAAWAQVTDAATKRVATLARALRRLTGGGRTYYVLSTKKRDRGDDHLVWWGPNANGYTWALGGAGRYEESEVLANQGYYDNEDSTVAVPCEAVEALTDPSGNVPNKTANKRKLLAAAKKAREERGQKSLKAERASRKRAARGAKAGGDHAQAVA